MKAQSLLGAKTCPCCALKAGCDTNCMKEFIPPVDMIEMHTSKSVGSAEALIWWTLESASWCPGTELTSEYYRSAEFTKRATNFQMCDHTGRFSSQALRIIFSLRTSTASFVAQFTICQKLFNLLFHNMFVPLMCNPQFLFLKPLADEIFLLLFFLFFGCLQANCPFPRRYDNWTTQK